VRDQAAVSTALSLERPPNLPQTLAHARMGNGDPCLRVVDGDVWRATRTPLGLATERVRLSSAGAVLVDAWGPGAEWLVERAPELCGALDHPDTFQPDQPLLRLLVHSHPGLRIGRTAAVFETAMIVTLEQRVATRDAWRSWWLMVRALSEPAPGPFPGLWAPPSPERIAHTPYEVFHRFGIERRRADVLRRLAIVARRLEETVSLSLDTAYRRFRAVTGVGPWTAARIGLIALGDPDAVAVGDLHLPHVVSWWLAGERRGSDERMLELLEPFRGHRGRVIRLLMAGAVSRAAFRIASTSSI
jgi:3-methyladenine DNA glycosylase/8-oxoguanine DNA glycosylase